MDVVILTLMVVRIMLVVMMIVKGIGTFSMKIQGTG